MNKIYSPDRSELQDAFANQFKNIAISKRRKQQIWAFVRDWMLLISYFLLVVAFVAAMAHINSIDQVQ